MNTGVQWELDWIGQNVQAYDSPMHAEAVKGNIQKRAIIKDLEERVKVLEKSEFYIRLKVVQALESLQMRINTAKHYDIDPHPLVSDEWKERMLLIGKLRDEYQKTSSSEAALTLIGVLESSAPILYGA